MAAASQPPRRRRIDLPGRGGGMAAIDLGPEDRAVDVVFAHANGFNARTYLSMLRPLADRLRILAVDLRGHGHTDLPLATEERSGWSELRDDHLALMEVLEVEGVVLAGHSLGGTVSLLAAAEAPSRVLGLVLAEPVIAPAEVPPTGAAEVEALAAGALRRRAVFAGRAAARAAYLGRGAFATWPAEMVDDYLLDGLRDRGDGQVELSCPPAWEASNFLAQHNPSREALARLTRPVRILCGETGSTTRLDGLERLPGVSAELVPGTGHFLPMERPDVVRAALLAAAAKG